MNRRSVIRKCFVVVIAVIASVSVALLMVGCGGSDEGGTTDQAAVFKIGNTPDLSGPYSLSDTMIRDGAQFAVDEINAAGGVNGTKLELIVKDSKNDKALALQATQELIDEGVGYLICTTADHVTAQGIMAGEAEIPTDTAAGTAPNLPRDAGPWQFQYIAGDNVQGAAMANYCYTELGYRTAFIVKSPDIAYSNNLPLYFAEVFKRLGGEIVGQADYKVEAGDFSAQITKIMNTSPRPDMVYTPMWLPDTAVFLKQYSAAGVDIPLVGGEANDTAEILPIGATALDGFIFPTFAVPDPGTALAELYDKYEAETGAKPESIVFAEGYDIIYILKAALEQTGGEAGQALRDAIANLSGVQLSTADDFAMNPETRQAKRELILLRMDGAEFTTVQPLPFPEYVPEPY